MAEGVSAVRRRTIAELTCNFVSASETSVEESQRSVSGVGGLHLAVLLSRMTTTNVRRLRERRNSNPTSYPRASICHRVEDCLGSSWLRDVAVESPRILTRCLVPTRAGIAEERWARFERSLSLRPSSADAPLFWNSFNQLICHMASMDLSSSDEPYRRAIPDKERSAPAILSLAYSLQKLAVSSIQIFS